MSGMRIFVAGLVGALLLGGVWWVTDLNKPTVEKCLVVGEPPNGQKPLNIGTSAELKQEQVKLQAVLPGQVVSLQAQRLSFTQPQNETGRQRLLIQVKAQEMDPQTLPEQYKAGLLKLEEQFFSVHPTYGALRLEVFRNGLWVYGAEVVNESKNGPKFYVQQDWRCHDVVKGLPKI